jgi:hypothetical protein
MALMQGKFLAVNLVSGLAGGLLAVLVLTSGRSLQVPEAVAQESAPRGSAASPKVLSAEEFRLLDAQGRTRAVLGFTLKGQPMLQMRDENDTYIVWLGISDESGLAIRDRDGKTRLVLGLDPLGEPSITMRDRNQKMKSIQP